jgi:type VI secretion system protein ImpB
MDESRQHWLDRNRPPRVQITYDVETLGATVKQEIPFVVGVLGDFTGATDPADAATRKKLADRRFVEIDRDNFDKVMGSLGASAKVSGSYATPVKNADGAFDVNQPGTIQVSGTLAISGLDDFSPRRILEQLAEATTGGAGLADLLKTRRRLGEMLVKLYADEGITADLTDSSILDTAWDALGKAKDQADLAAAALARINRTATTAGEGEVLLTDFVESSRPVVGAVIDIYANTLAAFKTAMDAASIANGARATDQAAAAAKFQQAATALGDLRHAAEDAAQRITAAVPAPAKADGTTPASGDDAAPATAASVAKAVADAVSPLVPLAQRATALAGSAALRFPA